MRRSYIFRDSSGNQYHGTALGRALMRMPEEARRNIKGAGPEQARRNVKGAGPEQSIRNFPHARSGPPKTLDDLWKATEPNAEPNVERVYRA